MPQCQPAEFFWQVILHSMPAIQERQLAMLDAFHESLAIMRGVELVMAPQHKQQRAGDPMRHAQADIAAGVNHACHGSQPGASETGRVGDAMDAFFAFAYPAAGVDALEDGTQLCAEVADRADSQAGGDALRIFASTR